MGITRLRSPAAAARWLREWTTGALRSDSREVRLGDAFVAWPGHATDGRRFVTGALGAGAATCLVEAEGVEAYGFDSARIGALPGLKAAAGEIADHWFGEPSARLDVVATTGTNGKTSTAWWTAQALTALGRRCGVIGTLGIGEPPRVRGAVAVGERRRVEFTGLTTPDPVRLHGALRDMVDAGFRACAIEASSIGVIEHRLAGLRVAVALYTNFTRDHLDYHGTMEAYWNAKARLFAWPGLRAAVVNIDDEKGAELAAVLARRGVLDLWTYSVRGAARLVAADLGYDDGGLGFDLREQAPEAPPRTDDALRVQTALIGDYNASNLLAVIGGLRALGVPLVAAANVCAQLTPVPGRMQRVGGGAPEVVVDYAHTPDALKQAIGSLRPLAEARGGAVWCVFGCGGNRDASKRPLMGAIACGLADRVVLTSDNPRREDPNRILADIAAGVGPLAAVEVLADRRDAIAHAVLHAAADDVVLIAGKGHEDYQEIAGAKHPFSDVVEAERALQRRGGGSAGSAGSSSGSSAGSAGSSSGSSTGSGRGGGSTGSAGSTGSGASRWEAP
jgi:UDP-N-acetylmuramoyl-L-alanyl-D-glutamate--2,6-diaminopimelate ligase